MDDFMDDLFGDHEIEREKMRRKAGLVILKRRKKTLTKTQQAFNRLTKRIETLHQAIHDKRKELENILLEYIKELPKTRKTCAECELKLAKILGDSAKYIKYGKRQIEDLREVVLDLLDSAFADIVPDEETKSFYHSWSGTSYDDEEETEEKELKEAFAEQLRNIFGIDVDFSELDDTPEGFAAFQDKFAKEFANKDAQNRNPFSKQKKTQKQLEKEQAQKLAEEQQTRSMRNVYLSLAKALHPDTVSDPEERLVKENLLKKVTVAYEEKDLATLLKLELEFVASEHSNLEKMSDEKLQLYVASLKEQVAALEDELRSLPAHPRYFEISAFGSYPEPFAKQRIKEEVRDYQSRAAQLNTVIALCSLENPKQLIMEFVHEYLDDMESAMSYDAMMMKMLFPSGKKGDWF